jgi:hypothetical protein
LSTTIRLKQVSRNTFLLLLRERVWKVLERTASRRRPERIREEVGSDDGGQVYAA